ncbi:hypothetical protein GGR56DRAFT_688361 [Xylariaceae sp. FL0804]|nr:hypothetical protein GGR56DRAFT_688361 [Xylariaceae sp. FL0804]
MPTLAEAVAGITVAFSFILVGNAITQSFMGVPALLVDFPPPSSPDEHAARARLLGRQWLVFWVVGNRFFRPISTLGIFGYAYAAWAAYQRQQQQYQHQQHGYIISGVNGVVGAVDGSGSGGGGGGGADWRLFAVSALCHLVTVVHSAVNMQPVNEQLAALDGPRVKGGEAKDAEAYARRWIELNLVRLIMPTVAGTLALWQILRGL